MNCWQKPNLTVFWVPVAIVVLVLAVFIFFIGGGLLHLLTLGSFKFTCAYDTFTDIELFFERKFE